MWYFQVGMRCSDWRVVIDPSPFWASCMLAKPGITVRLTRNVDKPRGFVNGAVGIIQEVFSREVFSVKLVSNDALVLVHPMWEGGRAGDMFVPCCYGYATTIRRAQGSTLIHGCLYLGGSKYPAVRGYGYVAVSRFKSKTGVFILLLVGFYIFYS